MPTTYVAVRNLQIRIGPPADDRGLPEGQCVHLPDRSAGDDGKARAAVRRRSGYVRGVGILDYRLVLGQIIHGCFSIVLETALSAGD